MDRNNMRHSTYNNGTKSRTLPPRYRPPEPEHNNNTQHANQQDDIIHYIYDAWNKVTREVERGSEHTRYYYEPPSSSRHLTNFRPFDLEEWWGRRLMDTIKHQQHS